MLPTAEDLKAVEASLAPGVIILSMRQRFIPGPGPDFSERLIRYGAVSAAYYAFARPLLELAPGRFGLLEWKFDLLEYVLIPGLIGALAAIEARGQLSDRLWRRLGAHNQPGD
jgi:hypothetical protein